MISDTAKKICMAFGVPLAMLTAEYQNKAVSTTTLQNFYDNVIDPLHDDIDAQLNIHFQRFDDRLVIKHEPRHFTDPTEKIAQDTFNLSYGLVTRNELRIEMGKPPIEGGDEPLLPSGFMAWSQLGQQPEAPEPLAEPTPEPEDDTEKGFVLTEIEATKAWHKKDASVDPHRKRIESDVATTFKALGKEVERNIKGGSKSWQKAGISADINLFDVKTWEKKIADSCTSDVKRYVLAMMEEAAAEINYDFIESDWDKDIAALTKNSTMKIAESINTIHSDLKSTIKNIIEANPTATKDELLEKILAKTANKFSDVYTLSRAANIATTTTTYAAGAANDKVWKELGFGKVWLSQRDGIVRITHRQADGKKPAPDGLFRIGYDVMPHPGGGSLAEENCNCRCYTKAVKK